MIETLARKRTNAVALAVIAGLVAALFVVLQSASAQVAGCAANPGISLGIGESCTVTHTGKGATVAAVENPTDVTVTATVGTPAADGVVTIAVTTGSAIGTSTVTISDTATDQNSDGDTGDPGEASVTLATYEVTVLGFGIKSLAVKGDTDNVVSAGPQITVVATIRSAVAASAVRLTVPTTGLSIHDPGATDAVTDDTTTQTQTKVDGSPDTQMVEFTVNTAGAPAGDYALTFTADQDGDFTTRDNSSEPNKQATQVLTLTIGDPGMGLASATLSLGNSSEDLPFTDANEAVAETGSASAATGSINLVIEAFDSLGGKANSSAVNQIIIIAPGGDIASSHNTGEGTVDSPTKAGGSSSATLNEQDASETDAAEVGDVGQRTQISVSKTDKKPGTVTVYAIVSGPGGASRTEDVTLTFSGPAASMSIADATESLLSVNTLGDNPDTDAVEDDFVIQDTIKLVVTAEDSGGNTTAPPTGGVSIVITDPDGKRQGSSVIGYTQPTKVGTSYLITLTGKGIATKPLKAGTWTLKATSGKLEATATFAVAGAPADVAVSASQSTSDTIGDVITVTASVTDKDGNTVSDGTMVMFSVSANTGLAAIGTGHSGKATKNGEASVKYAVVGAGSSVVSAEAGDATGVTVIVSTAGATAPADAGPSLSDFGNGGATGLTSWNGPDASASELLALLAGRANAIWLSNNGGWVLYTSVEGVPNSVDFNVTSGNVIYISN